jgi:nucleoid-associated protein YgaU
MPAKSVYERLGTSTLVGSDQTARKHIYKANERLSSIACYEYGDISYDSETWRQLAEYNNIDDLDAIVPGTVLTLPQITPIT